MAFIIYNNAKKNIYANLPDCQQSEQLNNAMPWEAVSLQIISALFFK
jgi:hypothetical protein